jgi:hypothetical protein
MLTFLRNRTLTFLSVLFIGVNVSQILFFLLFSNHLTLSVPDEDYSNHLTLSVPDEGYSNNLTLSVPDEDYSRNMLCELKCISMFLSIRLRSNYLGTCILSLLASYDFCIMWFSNLLTINVHDKDHSRYLTLL